MAKYKRHFSKGASLTLRRQTLVRLEIDVQVSHDFLPTSYNVPGISSSVHLTVEGGGEKYGDSVPAVFFHPQVTSSHFCNT